MDKISWIFNKKEKEVFDSIVTYLNLSGYSLLSCDSLEDVEFSGKKVYVYVYGKNRIPFIRIECHFYKTKFNYIYCHYKFGENELIGVREYGDIERFRDFILKNF